jgi:autotransporter strand-loop-strand O-heptosyltransferase
MKVRAHTCYLGKSGYSAHAREFFRALSKHVDLKVRNYTWDDKLDYLNEVDLAIIDKITLSNNDGHASDYPINSILKDFNWAGEDPNFKPDVDIVLMDMDHHYFYEEYSAKTTIAFTVWESTQLPQNFFDQLLKFDYLWVVSEWHKQVAVNQGYPEYRVKVVHEGVNHEFLTNDEYIKDPGFNFLFFGRWDYRKAVPEIIDSFLKAFPNGERVNLILNADNPYAVDGMHTTEERLEHYGFRDDRIKVKHFMSREEYVNWIKTGDVLVTCARSEGWNIPLIEALAAGTPALYSNWGAQLEFAEGLGIPVEITDERPAKIGADLGFAGATPGLYAEPDYEDLIEKLRWSYTNYSEAKAKALADAQVIRENFNWDKVGEEGYEVLKEITNLDLPEAWQPSSVVIMSHADTPDKLALLKQSIIAVKKKGYPVIVSSHIQVPDEIYELSNYVVYDKENPVVFAEEYSRYSNMTPIHQFKYGDFELAYPFDFNHGYAALKLIKNGLAISSINQYPITHFVNYDYVLNTDILAYHNSTLIENDIVTYRWGVEDSLNTGLFSIKTEKVKPAFDEVNSKAEYFKYHNLIVLEDIVFKIFNDYGFKVDILDIETIKRGNLINEVMTSAYPQLTKKGLPTSYCYLAKDGENGKKYIAIISGDNQFGATIKVGGATKELRIDTKVKFIEVTDALLNLGITLEFREYGITNYYDFSSKMANCILRETRLAEPLTFKGDPSKPVVNIHFVDGPFVEILTNIESRYLVEFIDRQRDEVVYATELNNNCWARCNRQWFTDWQIKVTNILTREVITEHNLNLTGMRVMVSLGSSSLGDTISWFAPIEEFQKKHGCKIIVCTFKNELFEENYPNFEWVKPGVRVDNIYANYSIGWFYRDDKVNTDMHPRDFKKVPMQVTATDILGLPENEIVPRLVIRESERPIEEDYVCLAIHSTAQAKYWNNPTGWQEVTDYFLNKGIKVVILSIEGDGYMGNSYPKGVTLIEEERTFDCAIKYLKHSKAFIGIGSGLSWLSWATGTQTVIISGFSAEWTETVNNTIRIKNPKSCNSCFNRHRLDASDWQWCPDHKGTDRHFECTRLISAADVISEIEKNNLV